MNNKLQKYLFLIVGNLVSAYAVISILRPNGLMTGGITGLSRVIERAIRDGFMLDPMLERYIYSIVYYLLAIFVLVACYVLLGKDDAIKIVFLSLTYPLLLFLFTFIDIPAMIITVETSNGDHFRDILVPALAFGVLSGIGTGLTLRAGFTSGGSDTIAKIIYRRLLPFVGFNQVLLLVDGIIILSSLLVFDVRIAAYALITKYIHMKATEMIVLGIGNKRVKMEILSTKFEDIIPFIQNSIHRGVTIVDTEGGFNKSKLKQIITICSPRESLQIKNFIARLDENAFVYVIPSSTVWGKGFRNIKHDELS